MDSSPNQICDKDKSGLAKILLVGDSSPPGRTDFYNLDSTLFKAVKEAYGHNIKDNDVFLHHFQAHGFYFFGLIQTPTNIKSENMQKKDIIAGMPKLEKKIRDLNPKMVICIGEGISAFVQSFFQTLRINTKKRTLPSPVDHYADFVEGFKEILIENIDLFENDEIFEQAKIYLEYNEIFTFKERFTRKEIDFHQYLGFIEFYTESERRPIQQNMKKYLVALVDVLGFKNKLKKLPVEAVVRLYEELIDRILTATNIETSHISSSGIYVTTHKIKFVIASDSIFLWQEITSKDLNEPPLSENKLHFINAVELLLINALLMEMPVRVGIAYGDCFIDEKSRIFIGQPIVGAYQIEDNQEWIGCGIHDSAMELFKKSPDLYTIIEYNVPTKVKEIQHTIKWMPDKRILEKLMADVSTDRDLNEAQRYNIKKKYQNTLDFREIQAGENNRKVISIENTTSLPIKFKDVWIKPREKMEFSLAYGERTNPFEMDTYQTLDFTNFMIDETGLIKIEPANLSYLEFQGTSIMVKSHPIRIKPENEEGLQLLGMTDKTHLIKKGEDKTFYLPSSIHNYYYFARYGSPEFILPSTNFSVNTKGVVVYPKASVLAGNGQNIPLRIRKTVMDRTGSLHRLFKKIHR